VALTPERERAYADFIASDPEAMIYGTLEYRNFLRSAVGGTPVYFLALRQDRIVGTLPLFVASHDTFGQVINSLPWFGSHGGCQVASGDADARVKLLTACADVARGCASAFTTLILSPAETPFEQVYAGTLDATATDARTGQVTQLPLDSGDVETQLEATFRQKTRNLVRKARNQGFTLRLADDDEGWDFLFATHVENMRAMQGNAKPRTHFDALRANVPARWRQLLVTMAGDEPVAALLLLRFNRTVEYLTPVIKHEHRSTQPLSFAIWHGMLHAVRDGFRYWNWGGTWNSQTTLHHFKAGWGAIDRPYRYVVRATPEAQEFWRARRHDVVQAFPYYYVYPFEARV
jgi:hypothetical protein